MGKRRRGSRNYVTLGYEPRPDYGVPVESYLRGALAALRGNDWDLRLGDEPHWQWRNKRGGPVRSADQSTAQAQSRSSFTSLMIRRLERDLASVQSERAPEPEPAPPQVAKRWTLGTYSRTRAALHSIHAMTPKQAARAYRHLTRLLGHRGVTAADVAKHPGLAKRAVLLARPKKAAPRSRRSKRGGGR